MKIFLYAIVLMAFSYVHCADDQHPLEDWFPKKQRANFSSVHRDLEKINHSLQALHEATNAPHHVQDGGSPRLEISKDLALMMRLSADIMRSYSQNYCLTLRSIAALGCCAVRSGAYLLEWTATYWCPKQESKVEKKED